MHGEISTMFGPHPVRAVSEELSGMSQSPQHIYLR
jgi:hypothetical protein